MRVLVISGYVAVDAEVKTAKDGKEFITFRFVNHEFNKSAEDKRDTYWYRVSAPISYKGMVQYLTKGKTINIVGRYSDGIWKRDDGTAEIQRDIYAESISFSEGAPKNGNGAETTGGVTDNPQVARTVQDTSEDDLPF